MRYLATWCVVLASALAVHAPAGATSIPTDGLAYYPFTDGSVEDFWGTNHGTNYGAVPVGDRHGCHNRALYFDGSDYVEVINLSSVAVFSVSVWAYHEDQSHSTYVIGGDDGNYADRGFLIGHINGVKVGIGDNHVEIPNLQFPIGEWTHVVLQYTSDDVILHIDGDLVWNHGAPAANWNETEWDVGSSPLNNHSSYYFLGSIDDVRIYDRPLTEEEIDALYEESKPCVPTMSQWGLAGLFMTLLVALLLRSWRKTRNAGQPGVS